MIFSYRILIKLINPLIIILLPSIILSGCASHYSNSASELTNLHGALKKSGNQGVHPVRLIAYPKNPTVFGQSVKVSDLKSILVIDAQFEFKKEGDIPLFRVKLNPQNIPQDTWQQLPSTLNITLRYGRHDQLFMFSTAIAKNKGTGDITSPWTYCDKCVGLVESTQRYANINLYHQLNKFVDSQNLKFYTALLRFEGKPKNPFKTGEELTQAIAANKAKKAQIAKAKAEKAKQERLARLREEEEQRMYGEVRQAYLDFVQTANNESLQSARYKACGKLSFSSLPNPRYASAEEINRAGMKSKDTFVSHFECVNRFLNDIDLAQWEPHLQAMTDIEGSLWPQTFLPENKRTRALTLTESLNKEKAYLIALENDYKTRINKIEKLWEDYEHYEEKRRKKAREVKIQAEVKRCLYTLASKGALTTYSDGYCRAQAEKGISGYQAGMIGSAGSKPSNSALLYQRNELPAFDLQGMIDNAKAVTKGASPNILWDESGSIRTSRAPEVSSYRNTPNSNHESRGISSGQSTRGSDLSVNTDSSTARINKTQNNEKNAKPTRVANSQTESENWPTRFMLSYVEDTGMINGAIQLFSHKKVNLPLVSDTLIAAKVKPFITSNKVCSNESKMPADLRFVVYAYWNNPSRQQVEALQQAIRNNPFIKVSPANQSNNDFESIVATVGINYKGQKVHWQTTEQFRSSLADSGCSTLVWNGDFESKIPISRDKYNSIN